MKILGIETSCDETAAAVVENGTKLLSNIVSSSVPLFKPYGGVVPEIAARAQIEYIMPVIDRALQQAFALNDERRMKNEEETKNPSTSRHSPFIVPRSQSGDLWSQIDAIGVTYGPGLGGSLLIGVLAARTLAIVHKKPLYAVNHVTAHVYANFLTEIGRNMKQEIRNKGITYSLMKNQPEFPLLALIVSGGHSQLVIFKDHFDYKLLGQTHDDAIGEAFDKVAKMIGLPYPGGPSIEKAAPQGDAKKYKFPKAKLENKFDYSFSGLKTAVLRASQQAIGKSFDFPSYLLPEALSAKQKDDIAASFQRIAVETVVDKTVLAYEKYQPKSVVIAGGVAANKELRRQLEERLPIKLEYPDIKLCTDNGAMIAACAYFMAQKKLKPADPYLLEIEPNLSM